MELIRRLSLTSGQVTVKTIDSQEFQYDVESKHLTHQLLQQVADDLGLEDTLWFGFQYVDSGGYVRWLSDDKRVLDHNLDRRQASPLLTFKVKLYPRHFSEMKQEVSLRLLYHQVREEIDGGDLVCPPHLKGLLDEYHQTDAMKAYLQEAQKLEGYGVTSVVLTRKDGIFTTLSVYHDGLSLHPQGEEKTHLQWSEIRTIDTNDLSFIVTLFDRTRPVLKFSAVHSSVSRTLRQLCEGYQVLHLRDTEITSNFSPKKLMR